MEKVPAADVLNNISQQINHGDHTGAIERLDKLIELGNENPIIHRLQSLALAGEGQEEQALDALKKARNLRQESAEEEINFGRSLNDKGADQMALECFLQALRIDPENVKAMALAGMAYASLGQTDNARKYGQKVLDINGNGATVADEDIIKREKPKRFDPKSRHRNIISYSLFGDNSYYHDAAVTAARMSAAIYPEWTCRFYCDPTLPEGLLQYLNRLGAQTLVAPAPPNEWAGLFWRFCAFDDPNVDTVMIRDVDSPFTVRERLAVDEWLESEYPFHVIRDHLWHMAPMMAGLWGGFTGLLPTIQPLYENFKDDESDRYSMRFKDQRFLALNIWPRIREATLVHDRYYQLGETRLPPEHPTQQFNHIGFSWLRKGKQKSFEEFIGLPE